ncbi:MAG: SMP-30/gluconolactonase/LRE family protein [Deltaproteobacteria bacterium]
MRVAACILVSMTAACVPSPEVTGALESLVRGSPSTVDGWYRFSEGPTRARAGDVYFSNLPSRTIHRWHVDGHVETVRDDGEMTNGLAVGPDDVLYVCEPYLRRVVALEGGETRVVADRYDGKILNSPNDVWVHPRGVYFTDPRYSKDREMQQDGEHVYFVAHGSSDVVRVTDDLVRPNGVVGTADALFVADDGVGKTYRYDIAADGTLSNRALAANAGADGLTLDADGRLYVVAEVVEVFEDGERVGTIDTPFRPTNVTFGGADGRTLFITGKWVVNTIEMSVRGAGI